VAIVWPCHLSVEKYAQLGRDVEVARPQCPSCAGAMKWWSGYWRKIRHGGAEHPIFIRRASCALCQVTHALLPAFAFVKRLYDADTIGAVIAEVVAGESGVRPAAAKRAIVHETARDWVRRFRWRAAELATSFAALAVELGGETLTPSVEADTYALAALGAAFAAAGELAGWAELGRWRFAAAVSGGRLLSSNTNSPYLVVGRRRFMPPVQIDEERNKERDGP
jgi:hypothetical protein